MHISINNLNYTPTNNISQENYTVSFNTPISSKILIELFELKGNCQRTGIANVMNELLYRYNVGKSMKVAQQTIATKVKLTRFQVGILIRKLESIGLITRVKYNRDTYLHTIDPIFFEKHIRIDLQHLLPELKDTKINQRKLLAEIICINRSVALSQKKTSQSLYGINIKENLSTLECDDGAMMFDEVEPDWLIAAGMPIVTDTDFNKKGNSSMQETLYSKQLLPIITQLKSIRPTIWGQIKLSSYPDEAILYADEQLLASGKKIEDPWRYFVSICNSYCKQHGIEISWSTMLRLGQQYCMPNDGPWIDASFIPNKPVFKTVPTVKSQKSSNVGRQIDSQKAQQNEAWYKQFDRERALAQQAKCAAEFEEMEKREPEKYSRIMLSAQKIRQSLGLDEEGNFTLKPVAESVDPIAKPNNIMQILQSITNLARPVVEPAPDIHIEYETEDYYELDSDPFGDRN